MCVIIVKQSKDKKVSRGVLKTSSKVNPHGLGVVWLDTFEVSYHKSKDYKVLDVDRPYIAHFRYATVGKVNRANTHPFVCGNNADELKTASILLDNTVIRPFQHLLIDSFDQILAYNKISLKLYFKTLQPLEFTDLENVEDEETKEEETGVKLSQKVCCEADDKQDLSDEEFDIILDELRGEEISNRWEEVDAREYDAENEDIEVWADKNIESKVIIPQQFGVTIFEKFINLFLKVL